LDELAYERVYWHHALSFQLAQRNENGPLIRAAGMEAVDGQVNGFTDAHASVTKEQEDIGCQIIAAEQLLLNSFILFGSERAWQPSGTARGILAMQ
jgi:hypothetical protein